MPLRGGSSRRTTCTERSAACGSNSDSIRGAGCKVAHRWGDLLHKQWFSGRFLAEGSPITLRETVAFSPERAPDVLEVDQALNRLADFDERKAKVIELRYFGGMSREEIATALSLTVPTVKRDLRLAEAWLRRYLTGQG